MLSPDELKAALERLATGTYSNADIQVLRQALQAEQIALATGERAVAVGGDTTDAIFITGDDNVVISFKGANAVAIQQAMRHVLDTTTADRHVHALQDYLSALCDYCNQLKRPWQLFLLALIFAVLAFFYHQVPATFLAERFSKPQFLYLPEPSQDWLDFRARELTLVGRSQELEELSRFLNQKERFSWWWLNGGAGSGKSRLALEWVISLPKAFIPYFPHGYDAGFFREVVTGDYWKSWQPRRPTLIVIDDAAEHVEAILTLLGTLGERVSDLNYPVRVLLVERSLPEHLKRLDEESRYYNYRYRLKPLIVSPLGPEHLQQLAQELAAKRDKTLKLTPQEEQEILRISQGLPLLMILALDNLLEYGELRWDTREELLQEQIQRMRAKFLHSGLEARCLPLLALATLTRGLPWEAAKRFQPASVCHNKSLLDRVFYQDIAQAIPPIQPDLLGEYFLLEEFGKLTGPEREDFLRAAWEVAPEGVADTLYNLTRDFPQHPQFAALDRPPDQPEAAVWWSKVRVRLLGEMGLPVEEMQRHLQNLLKLAQARPDSADIQLELAKGEVNAIARYGEGQHWDETQASFQILRDVAGRFPDSTDIQLALAKGAANAILHYGNNRCLAEMQAAFQTLKDVSRRFPDHTGIQSALADGMSKVMYFSFLMG